MIFDLPPKPAQLWLPPKPAIILPHKKPAVSRGFMFPVVCPRGVGSRTFLQSETQINASQTTYTFNNVNIGAASADRYVVVCTGGYSNVQSRTLNSATIGGSAATIVANANVTGVGFTGISAILILNVPTGTTATVAVTFSAAMFGCWCHTYTLRGLQMSTPTTPYTTKTTTDAANATTLTDTINIHADGILIVGGQSASSTGTFSSANSGATFDNGTTANNLPDGCASKDHLAVETGRSYGLSVSAATSIFTMAAATWY